MVLQGIIPVTVTPMNVDGTPDYGGHKRYIEYLLKHPIVGLWALGSAGESFLMSYDNRLRTAQILMELVGDQIPIIMGAASMAMDDIFRLFEETYDMPFYGLHVIVEKVDQNSIHLREIQRIFEQRCQRAGICGELRIESGRIAREICDNSRWMHLVIDTLKHPPRPQPLDRLGSGFSQ